VVRYEVGLAEFRSERAFLRRTIAIASAVGLVLTVLFVVVALLPPVGGEGRDAGFFIKALALGAAAAGFWFIAGVAGVASRSQKPRFVGDDTFLLDSSSLKPRVRRYEEVESARHRRRGNGDWAVLLRMKDGSELGLLPEPDTPEEVYPYLLERLRQRNVPLTPDETL
jgi:hypothetical protein